LAPQAFSPNTVMPSFWPNGKAIRPDIAGGPEDQVEALWQYLLDGRQARAPAGVIREPLEIVVTNEARMLRRKYAEIGKRGIGVGYPGGVNLAYDAEQMRLATLWSGQFIDPAGVWYGQGHGSVRALGRAIQLAKGPDVFTSSNPWTPEAGRPASHQFKGYTLDQKRRPEFRYFVDTVEVTDFLTEFNDEQTNRVQLRRRVKLRTPQGRDDFRFRLASNESLEPEADGTYRIARQLRVRIVSGHSAESFDGQGLLIPLRLVAAKPQEVVIEYLWE